MILAKNHKIINNGCHQTIKILKKSCLHKKMIKIILLKVIKIIKKKFITNMKIKNINMINLNKNLLISLIKNINGGLTFMTGIVVGKDKIIKKVL